MSQMENRDIVIDGRCFRDLDDLEDFCAYFSEFEDAIVESGILSSGELQSSVDTYFAFAEMEYGDGNAETACELHSGWYGEVFIDSRY